MLRKYPVQRYVDIQPCTDRIRFNKRIESEDIRYPTFQGIICTRPFLFPPRKRYDANTREGSIRIKGPNGRNDSTLFSAVSV